MKHLLNISFHNLSRLKNTSIIVLLTTFAVGCAPTTSQIGINKTALAQEAQKQQEFAVKDYIDNSIRLHKVSYPLVKSALPYCADDTRRGIGAMAVTTRSFPKELQSVANDLWNIQENVIIVAVVPNSPADTAGLKFGDVLKEVNGKQVKSGKQAIDSFYTMLTESSENITVDVTIQRDDTTEILAISTEPVCSYLALLVHDDAVNAFADGDNIFFNTGMMRFASTDFELSVVVAHEIAHNVMGHVDKKMTNYALGSVVDIFAAVYGVNTQGLFGNMAAGAYSKGFESEADYVGLYILEHAGYDIQPAPDFWRKMAIANPSNIKSNHGATHPATPERFLALENTIQEIESKKLNGSELSPNQKPKEDREVVQKDTSIY